MDTLAALDIFHTREGGFHVTKVSTPTWEQLFNPLLLLLSGTKVSKVSKGAMLPARARESSPVGRCGAPRRTRVAPATRHPNTGGQTMADTLLATARDGDPDDDVDPADLAELLRLLEDASGQREGGLTTDEWKELWTHLHRLREDAALYELWERGELAIFINADGELSYATRNPTKAGSQ